MAPAGYSTTPQARKLGLKAGQRVCLRDRPDGWSLQDPPAELTQVFPRAAADVVIAFVRSEAALSAAIAQIGEQIYPAGAAWIAWPRKAAGHVSEMTENYIREVALPLGLVDNKVAAIDDDWSGLRLVWRLAYR